VRDIPDEFPLPKEAFERQRALLSSRVPHQSRPSPLTRRRVLAPAFIAIAVLVIAGTATGAGVHLWGGPSTPSTIDTSKATKLVEFTLTTGVSTWKTGDRIAIWQMSQPDGRICDLIALASPKPTAQGTAGSNPGGGSSCAMPRAESQKESLPIRVILEASRLPGGSYTWLISGAVSSESDVARLEVRTPAGSVPLAYGHGAFLGQLPTSISTRELPDSGPYVIVGYNGEGTAVAHFDLQHMVTGSAAH
jgi:hypothetical protein